MQKQHGQERDAGAWPRVLTDLSHVMLWASGIDGSRSYFSTGWTGFTGRDMAAEAGDGWLQGVHAEDRDRCLAAATAALETRQPFRLEYRLRRHDGEYRWILDAGGPHHDRAGAFTGFAGSCMDIHDCRLAQEQIRQSLAGSERRLAEKDLVLREISHRVKNNLQLVVSLINMRARGARSPEIRKELEEIVNRILALGVGQEQLSRATRADRIDFTAFLQQFAAALRSLHARPGVELAAAGPQVLLSMEKIVPLCLIVNELVSNGYRHAFPEGRTGTIALSLDTAEAGRVVLRVSDNGVGMAPERASGFGSGLQIVEVLAPQADAAVRTLGGTHGGTHGGGTTVEITFPGILVQA